MSNDTEGHPAARAGFDLIHALAERDGEQAFRLCTDALQTNLYCVWVERADAVALLGVHSWTEKMNALIEVARTTADDRTEKQARVWAGFLEWLVDDRRIWAGRYLELAENGRLAALSGTRLVGPMMEQLMLTESRDVARLPPGSEVHCLPLIVAYVDGRWLVESFTDTPVQFG
jgi:hypothetical protein